MLERLAEIITDILGVSFVTEITEDTNLKYDLRADSYELMELVTALEEEYGITAEEDDLVNIETVGDIMDYIRSQGLDD